MRARFPLFIALTVMTAPVAIAQDQSLDTAAERTAACLEIEDPGERLACFEQAATGLNEALGASKAAPQRPDATAPEVAAETPAEPDAPEMAEQPAPEENTMAAAPAPQPEPAEAAPSPAPSTAEAPDSESAPEWAKVQSRPEKTNNTPDEINVSVVRILRNAAGRHYFITSDGGEWEQTMTGAVRPPSSLPAAATIKSSLIGSPRLTFDDGPSGAYKVRRVK